MPNIIDKVDKRSWGIKLLLGETTRTEPRDVQIVQMPYAPTGGWSFYMIKRAWRASLVGSNVRTIHIHRERGIGGVGVLWEISDPKDYAEHDLAGLPPDDECILIEMSNGSVQIFTRPLDASMLDVAADALLEGDKSAGYKAVLDAFGVAAGAADAITRARVKSLRLRQTAAIQGRTKASRRAASGRH